MLFPMEGKEWEVGLMGGHKGGLNEKEGDTSVPSLGSEKRGWFQMKTTHAGSDEFG